MTDDDSHLPRGDEWCDVCQKQTDHRFCYDTTLEFTFEASPDIALHDADLAVNGEWAA